MLSVGKQRAIEHFSYGLLKNFATDDMVVPRMEDEWSDGFPDCSVDSMLQQSW